MAKKQRKTKGRTRFSKAKQDCNPERLSAGEGVPPDEAWLSAQEPRPLEEKPSVGKEGLAEDSPREPEGEPPAQRPCASEPMTQATPRSPPVVGSETPDDDISAEERLMLEALLKYEREESKKETENM